MTRSTPAPFTPEQIAEQKAERSAAYRRSQNFRNLLIALAVTLGVVAIVIFGVPRGDAPERPVIDVEGIAETAADAYDRPVLVADVPSTWGVNRADISPSSPPSWTVVYTPPDNENYITLVQGFDADETWAAQELGGARIDETTTIAGIEWDVYALGPAQDSRNILYAIGTNAGDDHVVLFGSAPAETTADLAELISDQLTDLRAGESEEGSAE